jgi:hypothetical protein
MKLLRSMVLPAIGCGLLALSFSGCGGNTAEGSGNGAMGGTAGAGAQSGNAGSGNGGSAGSAGSSGSAGSAGRGSGGTLGAGSGGAAGTGAASGTGGAGGLPPEWLACSDTSECVVRENSCCEGCGPQDVNRAIAFHREYADAVIQTLCGSNPPPCPAPLCPYAPTYVLPLCIEGRCQAIDIRQDKLTSCSTEAQCRLRWGTSCCEPCGTPPPVMLVAVNSQVSYEQTVCGSSTGCPECLTAQYPTEAKAICGADKHCTVAWAR